MVAYSHVVRVLQNNPVLRAGEFLRGLRLNVPTAFRVYRIQKSVAKSLGRENIRAILRRWEPRLPAAQKGKWMTERDMRRGVKLALLLGLDNWPHRRILDIGCGTGFFLHVCKRYGHSVMGLDLPEQEMFREWTSFLDVPGVGFRIRPFSPLPPLDRKFDLVTMDSLTFDRRWKDEEWRFFLADLRNRLVDGGMVYAMLRYSERTRSLSNKEIHRIFSGLPGYTTRFLTGRHILLTKVEKEVAHEEDRIKQAV